MRTQPLNRALLAIAFVTLACGSGDGGPSSTTTEPGGNNNPTPTTGRITIQLVTSTPTIWAGAVYGRSGTSSSKRVDFISSDGRCASALASNACYYDVKIGDTISLAAMDWLAEPAIKPYAAVSSPDDPRTIESQFVSWSSPCLTRERGVCVFKVTGNQTVTAQYKALTLTRFYFSGLNPWQLTVTAPASLGLTSVNPPLSGSIRAAYGGNAVVGGPPFPRCIGGVPEVRCIAVLSADNSTIKMDIYPPDGSAPLGATTPLAFVGWGASCNGANTASVTPFAIATCTLQSGTDQTASVKWQYYQCPNGPNEGFSGWKYTQDPLRPDGCVLKP